MIKKYIKQFNMKMNIKIILRSFYFDDGFQFG